MIARNRPWLDDSDERNKISVERIAGWFVVLTIHAVAFAGLLLPTSFAPPVYQPDDRIRVIVVDVPPEPPPPPPPPPEPPKEVVIAPKAPPQKAPPTPPKAPQKPVQAPPIVVDTPRPADVAIDPTPPTPPAPVTDVAPPSTGPSGPPSGGGKDGLVAIVAPKPPYPPTAARSQIEGTVILRITVGPDGSPTDVAVQKTSGNRDLDRSARDHVKRTWKFQATGTVQIGILPISYSLE